VIAALLCTAPNVRAAESPASNTPASTTPASKTAASNTSASSAALVARGEYVALAADCMSCHTAPGGQSFAGGVPLKSTYGILYGPNITPDVQTGIGTWNKSDFEKALRLGIRNDGSYIYPAMPYDAYTKMTAADLDALWAYLRSVPAVKNTPPKNTLAFPLSIRRGVGLWQSLYFKPGEFVPTAGKNADWNRGAYLVEALAHCSECHTPRNLAQGLEGQHLLAGAQIEGWYAPDISNDSSSKINGWNTQQLARFLKSGVTPNNVKAIGPMQEAVHDSLRYLSDADLRAMALYLKNQPTRPTEVSASSVKFAGDRLASGKRVYEDACSSCHQPNGKGRPGSVPALAANDSVTAAEPFNVIMALLEGFPAQDTWGAMGSFANSLSDEQISDVTNYVRTAWGNNAAPNATPWSVSTWRRSAGTPKDESHALLCPTLATEVMRPALDDTPDSLRQAASSRTQLSKLVHDYKASRPDASSAQVVEALSTAYCRTLAGDRISEARMSAQIADFAQRVATALDDKKSTSQGAGAT